MLLLQSLWGRVLSIQQVAIHVCTCMLCLSIMVCLQIFQKYHAIVEISINNIIIIIVSSSFFRARV